MSILKFTLMQLILFSGLLASTTMAMEWDTPDNNQTDLTNLIMQKTRLLNYLLSINPVQTNKDLQNIIQRCSNEFDKHKKALEGGADKENIKANFSFTICRL